MREAEAMKKYENLIFYKQPEHVTALVDGTPLEVTDDVEGVGMRGACQIPGAHAFINGGLVTEPVFMDPYPHKHDADEYLVFLGPPNDRYHFNAHVELTMGIDEDAEVYNIDEPTMVRIPAGGVALPAELRPHRRADLLSGGLAAGRVRGALSSAGRGKGNVL